MSEGPPLSAEAERVLGAANDEARRRRSMVVGPLHILLAVLRTPDGITTHALRNMAISKARAVSRVESSLGPDRGDPGIEGAELALSHGAAAALDRARREAGVLGFASTGPEMILVGLLESKEPAALVFSDGASHLGRLRDEIARLLRGPDETVG